jgi:hypothetical protein
MYQLTYFIPSSFLLQIIGKAGKLIRLVRVLRIMRIFKLVRHFAGLQSLIYTLKEVCLAIKKLANCRLAIISSQ